LVTESVRVTLIQIFLSDTNFSPLTSLYFFALPTLIINAILVYPLEGFAPLEDLKNLGPGVILLNCSLTLCLNLFSVALIGLSPVVMSLSKVSKDVITIIGSVIIFGEGFTTFEAVGCSIAFLGLLAYKFL